ncbi:ABC transporter ATP-binding protein [Plantactinospora soyae]|uniref:Oligopeptide/dipeptide ABC transporter ATP-binding protein n=1 Tax=Plantactinospora soyae TaxID=1544732 RepID=A0A927QVK6_9ACTN|nr:ABC transporter ATP-binding protein [Plantactinospora soyae]MBE1484487.1 oligopeptide/dipeptide ABC transporter ATP-binding protein [Plantactinospora soyae]
MTTAIQPGAATSGVDPEPPLLAIEDLSVTFQTRDQIVYAVRGVDLTVTAGQTLAVIGESGSGKTVTSRAVLGLLPRTATVRGSIRLGDRQMVGVGEKELRQCLGREVGMIFQDPARSLNPTMRIGNQITEAIRVHLPLGRREARERAIELLAMVRLPAPARRFHEYPHQLSGGMRQRVMIAIALACQPRLLIADEATTALDVTTQAQIMDLLLDLQQRFDMGLVLISHDMGLAASYADEIAVMYAGRVVERAPTRRMISHVRMPYTRALLDATPRLERPPHAPLPVISGRPPDLTVLHEGCAFAPRCFRVQEHCRTDRPALDEQEPDHEWACFFPCEDER